MDILLSSLVKPFSFSNALNKKSDDRTRVITDFVGGVGVGKEFTVITGVEGDFSIDTINVKTGTESVKATIPATEIKRFATAATQKRKLADFVSAKLYYFIENVAGVSNIYLYALDAGGTNGYSCTMSALKEGWNLVSLNRAEFVNVGTPTGWDNIEQWQFRVNGGASESYVTWDSLIMTNPENEESNVLFSFDDAFESVKTVVIPEMDLRGWKCTLFVNPSYVGTAGRLTVADLIELQTAGHSIGFHGYNHTDYATLTAAQIRGDIDKGIDWFIDNGLGVPRIMAYPGGTYLTPMQSDAAAERFALCRGTTTMPGYKTIDTLPFGYPDLLRSYGMSNGSANTITQLNKMVGNRAFINIYAHDVNEVGGSPASSIADFLAITADVATKGFDVITYDQLMNTYPRSIVR